MFKLIKYEFRKNLIKIIALFAIPLVLECWLLIEHQLENNRMYLAMFFMIIAAFSSFFIVFIMSISAYSKELSNKSLYLIFMTPNTTLSIIMSKLLYSLILGFGVSVLYFIFGMIDYNILMNETGEVINIFDVINMVLSIMGYDTTRILISIISFLIIIVVGFLSAVTLAYLAITLSATLLQNKKGRGLVSFLLYCAITGVVSRIANIISIPFIENIDYSDVSSVILAQLPSSIFQLIVMICAIAATAHLLKTKISL